MIANITWQPAAGGGTQTIQYKKSLDSVYTTFTTVISTVNTISVSGLDYNTAYDFRIVNNCPNGSNTHLDLPAQILIKCVTVTITPSDTNTSIQFFELGGSIDTYIVELINPNTNSVLQTKTLNAPFSASVVTTFTSLTALTSYAVRVKPADGSLIKTDCATTSFSTINTPSCPIPQSLSVSFS